MISERTRNSLWKKGVTICLGLIVIIGFTSVSGAAPLSIEKQGSFAVGGTVVEATEPYDPRHPTPQSQTLHGDHANVNYQIPVDAKKPPLVFLHGAGQSMRTWQSTPDGRDGYQNIFLGKGYPVYLVDQPRSGDAGRSTVKGEIPATPDEQFWFGQFRLGIWPDFYADTQFAQGEENLDQFFRQMTPNTGPFDAGLVADSLKALFGRIGDGVLVTHSQGCGPGWLAGMGSGNIKAIAAYEPGSGFVFPEGEVPEPIDNASPFSPLKASSVPKQEFMELTRKPIVIFYGDNIPSDRVAEPHKDYWRSAREMAGKFVDAVNRHGGDACIINLPDRGLTGNTHFPFSDRNNEAVAEIFEQWLKQKGLD